MYGEDEKNLREPIATVKWKIDGKELQWISPEHCMVLIGYDLDKGVAIMADPQRGIAEYDLYTVKSRYIAIHSQCVVLEELPCVEGVEDGSTYYTTQYVTFSKDFKKVTLNGEEMSGSFLIEGNVDKEYTITATDNKGNTSTITVKTKPIISILEPISTLSELNVNEQSHTLIDEIKTALLELETKYSPPDESRAINDAIAHCDKLLDVIDKTKTELTRIDKRLSELSVNGIDSDEAIEISQMAELLDGMIMGNNLTSEQQIIANNLKTRCNNLLSSVPPDTME